MTSQETLVDRVKALEAAAFEVESLKLQIIPLYRALEDFSRSRK